MKNISRRTALGQVAASMLAGAAVATTAHAAPARPRGKRGAMTLEEFRAMPGPEGLQQLLDRMDCETFTGCHERMREETGLWIPELVPVFAALDAMGEGEGRSATG